ncbi:MAG: thiolase family protein [Miltoncostaeaceae bacterium]
MSDAYIIDAVRTPIGRRKGALSQWHPADLLAETISALIERTGVDAALLDDVLAGCVDQVGEQSINIARSAAIAAGIPDSVPAATIDRQCGSSQQTAHFGAQGVMADQYDLVVSAGVESMTRVPMWANAPDPAEAYGPRFRELYGLNGQIIDQGNCGELMAETWGLEREELDEFAYRSHMRSAAATEAGRFTDEIIPIEGVTRDGDRVTVTTDEGIRPGTTMAALAGLKPLFREDGRLTAGTCSQISDGAAAVLIASTDAVNRLGLTPMARFHSFALAADDPILGLSAPIPATKKILDRSGLDVDQIDLFEISEAFSSVPLAWAHEIQPDMDRVNVNGGAISLGHPIGASGARIMATLVHEMKRRGARYGLQTMCEGGGMANATILELA